MIIELKDDYSGFKKYESLFYENNEEKKNHIESSEKIAYQQLKEELIKYGYENLIMNIGVEHTDYVGGGLCICRDGDYWLVFQSERNYKSNLSLFSSPYTAASFYLWNTVCDPKKENASVGMIPKYGTF